MRRSTYRRCVQHGCGRVAETGETGILRRLRGMSIHANNVDQFC